MARKRTRGRKRKKKKRRGRTLLEVWQQGSRGQQRRR
jgi:hypothetical protein